MTPTYASMRKPGQGAGLDASVMWMCGHQTRRGQYRKVPGQRAIAWRCATCAEAPKTAKAATCG